ncbi:biotin synthase [Sulfurovum sp. ST-21]|uniref:Biotin synthase n=1 Tax=Sulfurovum indicum TaxID=2779528 RepID=A0A7M1S2Z6_9BACT|nr:biotin synthase [Sulfurovum indicum]QOR61813.1 biotin synthase [Sulfurovum indicum]
MQPIFLCAINNILSGTCLEDCKFCTQSVRYHADIERYNYKPIDQIVEEAKQAKAHGALGYCLVTAGKGLDDKKVDFVARAAKAIKAEIDGLNLIACNGTASKEQLLYLKQHGLDSYNHNLETSKRYYPNICQTHEWEERYETCLNVKSVGLALCSGGIFGMGEREEDRNDLLQAIASLEPESTPLNFYHPNPALPIKTRNIEQDEAIEIIQKARHLLGNEKLLMVAGGRELLFHGEEAKMFEAGANAIVIGNYLTTPGEAPQRDREVLEALGYEVATSCDRH